MLADRENSITVVRHAGQVGYVTGFKSLRAKVERSGSAMRMAPLSQYNLAAPSFLDRDGLQADSKYVVTNQHHRDKMSSLVDDHQQEFPSCPVRIRALHYVRVPH